MCEDALMAMAGVPYFEGIPPSELKPLALAAVKRTYPANVIIINEGDDAGSLFIIVSGKAQAFLTNESGRMLAVSTREAGAFFGELSLLDGKPRSASVITLEPTVCLLISRQVFLDWLKDQPAAAENIIRNLTGHIRAMTEDIRSFKLSDVYGRLVKLLNEQAQQQGDIRVIPDRLSHHELATLVGCSRERVSRIMSELTRGGYLAREGRTLKIIRKLPAAW